VQFEGVIRGHGVTEMDWMPDARPPQARATLRVPLWGVDGVAALFWRTRQVQSRYARERIALAAGQDESPSTFVVIDARGLALAECLFPAIVDARGRLLYDIASLPAGTARSQPAVRYVRSEKTLEQLKMFPRESRADADSQVRAQTIAIRATGVTGPQRTELTVAAADADYLARSPQAVAAFRQARVLIVVDGVRAVP
jgi:hypothetical protein